MILFAILPYLLNLYVLAFLVAVSPGIQTMYVLLAGTKDPFVGVKMILASGLAHSINVSIAAFFAVLLIQLDPSIFMAIYRIISIVALFLIVVFCRDLLLSLIKMYKEQLSEEKSFLIQTTQKLTKNHSRVERVGQKIHQTLTNPYIFGVTTALFNPYYVSIMMFFELNLFLTGIFPTLRNLNITGSSAIGIAIIIVSLTVFLGLLTWFTPFGLAVFWLHERGGKIGLEILMIASIVTLVIMSLIVISTLFKIILGPHVLLPNNQLISPYGMSNGYLFHNVPILDLIF